ncbi:MAG: dephospho-CoA kinase [Bacteroidales bacterium]|nr:dephospho-CoA kinase [Bacteroidales bacterium]
MDMKKVKTLGCTGGIGSGKTYVSRIFESLGYPAYYSDDRAKLLYDTDPLLLSQMTELLGEDILDETGRLNRKVVASRIFGNVELLRKVEALVHPAVLRDFSKWKEEVCSELSGEGKSVDFVIFESAILLESTIVKGCADKILSVEAPYELRVERVMRRDGVSREQVQERIARQWSDAQRAALSDFIIFADSKRALLPQIAQVIEKMKGE